MSLPKGWKQQLALIRQLNTHEYQGFLFSEALGGDELKRFWKEHAAGGA